MRPATVVAADEQPTTSASRESPTDGHDDRAARPPAMAASSIDTMPGIVVSPWSRLCHIDAVDGGGPYASRTPMASS